MLGYTETICLAVVLACLLRGRMTAKWPSLTAAVGLELLSSVAIIFILNLHLPYSAYFYTYWISMGIQAVVRLWIIGDIIRSFPGTGFISGKVYLFVISASASMAMVSGAYCFYQSPGPIRGIVQTVIMTDRCVNIAWVTFAVALLGTVKLFALGWSPTGAYVANGVAVRICIGALNAEIVSMFSSPAIHIISNSIVSFAMIGVCAFWAYEFAHGPLEPAAPEPDSPAIRESLRLLNLIPGCRER